MGIQEDINRIKEELIKSEGCKVKIALFGQPGAGKSTLVNTIIGENKMKTGVYTDVTVEAEEVEKDGLIFVDLPGYGTAKFPKHEWLNKFKIEEFDIFLCVFSGKFHKLDSELFKELKQKNKECLFVRNKSDDIYDGEKDISELKEDISNDVKKHVESSVEVYFTSCHKLKREGISELEEAIEKSLEPAKSDRFIKVSKAYTEKHLEKKKEQAESLVGKYAGLTAANALNPIPGLDISVDIGMLLKLFSEIRNIYGLSDKALSSVGATFVPLANNIIKFATKEGIIILLKQFATKEVIKNVAKYIPFIGQIIAASAGFAITSAAGKSYLEDCHTLAKSILEEELKK